MFGLDGDGSGHGGITCAKHASSVSQQALLFMNSSLPQGPHTLFITNSGGQPLSINFFGVFGDGEVPSARTSQPQTPSRTTSHLSAENSLPPTPSPLPLSSTMSLSTGTTLSTDITTSLALPPPNPSILSRASSYPSQTVSDSAGESQIEPVGHQSHTVSSYTEVSTVDGSTVTIVIQTTIAVPQTQPYHGPSRGAVAGIALGGLLFLFFLLSLVFLWWRWRRNRVRFLYGISNLDLGTSPHRLRVCRDC